jgi:hypothetical protein
MYVTYRTGAVEEDVSHLVGGEQGFSIIGFLWFL